MSIKVRIGDMEVECSTVDDVMALAAAMKGKKPYVKSPPEITDVKETSYPTVETAHKKETTRRQEDTRNPLDVWRSLDLLDCRTVYALVVLLDSPKGVGMDSGILCKRLGLNSKKGLSGFSKHTNFLCRKFGLERHHVAYPVKGYGTKNATNWHAGDKAQECIFRFSGLPYETVMELATNPENVPFFTFGDK